MIKDKYFTIIMSASTKGMLNRLEKLEQKTKREIISTLIRNEYNKKIKNTTKSE